MKYNIISIMYYVRIACNSNCEYCTWLTTTTTTTKYYECLDGYNLQADFTC